MMTPWDFAKQAAIKLTADASGLCRLGTSGSNVVYAWDANPAVREARAWEGIARVILDRAGVDWSAEQARDMARQLRGGSGEWDSAPVNPRIRNAR